jgi:alpha-beta hydrolase superfamily lysophospholipase
MRFRRARLSTALFVCAAAVAAILGYGELPAIAAGGLLHPARHRARVPVPAGCVDADISGAGITLRGWRCAARGAPHGTIVYLHGVADNRASAAGVVRRMSERGFDVLAYDSRAHGDSGGEVCTYGFFEKEDLRKAIDGTTSRPVVLVGTSLGAAVALQEAPDDARVGAVVAAETFSDLRIVAEERAPRVLTGGVIREAFAMAEQQGHFVVGDVSPRASARRIHVPVLLVHGAADVDTPPSHSQRVFDALAGPKRLILVPGANHNQSLGAAWPDVEAWIDTALHIRRN